MSIKQFDIWLANMHPGKGTEPGKVRPVIVIQADGLNKILHPSTIVCPITSQLIENTSLIRVLIGSDKDNGLEKPSTVLIDQVTSVDNRRFIKKLGKMSDSSTINAICKGLIACMSLS